MTEEPAYEKINGLAYATTSRADRDASRASWSKGDVIASGTVLALILMAYLYFTG
jgi:SSS family solute:Na+ symporter